jgi:hypothetical protein
MPAAICRNMSPMSLVPIPSASAARQSAAILTAVAFSEVGCSIRLKIGSAFCLRRSVHHPPDPLRRAPRATGRRAAQPV